MKVGLLIHSLSHGGAERTICRLSFALSQLGHEVYIILLDGNVIQYEYTGKLINMDTQSSDGFLKKITIVLKRISILKKIKKKHKFDAVISFLENSNIINILSKKKEKCIISIRSYAEISKTNKEHRTINFINRLIYPRADYIVTVSKLIKHDIHNNYHLKTNRIVCIYNPYNIDEISVFSNQMLSSSDLKFYQSHRVIVSVGSFKYEKGYWNLLKSFYLLKQRISSVGLAIVGDGVDFDKVKLLCKNLSIEDSVLFVGYNSNPYKYIKNAEVYALTSISEGFPNALVEALACGAVVASSDCKSGPREILSPSTDFSLKTASIEWAEYGVLSKAFNDKEDYSPFSFTEEQKYFSDVIEELLNNTDLADSYRSQSLLCATQFSYERCASEYLKLISNEK